MITGLPLQNKLRTYKNEEKNNFRAFFQSVGLGPPHRKTRRKFPGYAHGYTLSLWERNDIAPKNLL